MNTLRVTVENPDDLLAGLGALARLHLERSTTGGGIGFSEVASSPQTLQSEQTLYVFRDTAGNVGDWYRARFTDSGNAQPQAYGAEFQGGIQTGIIRVEDLKQRLNIDALDLTDDEELIQLIGHLTALIHDRTQRMFLPDPWTGTKTYTFDGFPFPDGATLRGGSILLLPRGVRTVTLLELTDLTGNPYTTVPSTDYFLRPQAPDLDPGWPATFLQMTDNPSVTNVFTAIYPGFNTARVTGTFGWAAVPPEIEAIALATGVRYWNARQAGETDLIGPSEMGRPMIARLFSLDDIETFRWYRTPRAA